MIRGNGKKIFFQTGLMILISIVLLIIINAVISIQRKGSELKNRNAILRQTINAAVYVETELPEGLTSPEYIKGLYELYDRNGMLTYYLLSISADDEGEEKKVFHLVFDSTGTVLNIAKLYDETETRPMMLPDEFMQRIYDNRLPVMTDIDAERLRSAAAPPMEGLQDGIYRNVAAEPNKDGYIDYVEIQVQNGWIVNVKWDGESDDDPDKKSRAQASVDGEYDEYSTTGNMWAQQAYFMEKELVEVQDPTQIAVKSDGTTEIVEGVTCEITEFVNLAERCVQDSRIGKIYNPSVQIDEMSDELGDTDAVNPDENSLPDEDATPENREDSEARTNDNSQDTQQNSDLSGTAGSDQNSSWNDGLQIPGGTQNKNYSPGGEDGIIAELDEEYGRIYGFFREDMRSVIVGEEGNLEQQQILLVVNRAYSFLQSYLEGR